MSPRLSKITGTPLFVNFQRYKWTCSYVQLHVKVLAGLGHSVTVGTKVDIIKHFERGEKMVKHCTCFWG